MLRRCVPARATGAVVGVLVSLPLMSSLRSYLYEVLLGDWTAYAGAVLILMTSAAVALLVPVYHALKIDPASALRHD